MIGLHRALAAVGLLIPVRIGADGCPEGQCRAPNGTCAGEVQCFANPCQVQSECKMELCRSNYCGGCNHVCETEQLTEVTPIEHQMFADELTELLYENDNECSSAFGVSMAFSLIYPGSTGEGVVEIRDTLRYPNGSNMALVWEETTQRMLGIYDGKDMGYAAAPLLKIANGVWFDDDDTLDANYSSVVGEYAMQTNFEDKSSSAVVNGWVGYNTHGLIDSIVPEGKALWPPYLLIAINSIYLKATWNKQFKDSSTNLDKFYDSASRTAEASEAHFMHMVESFPYSHDALEGYQVIDLPFAASQMSMVFVLPASDDLEAVSSTDLIGALDSNGLLSTRVALALPKFKFESEYDEILKDSLEDMGIKAPFTEGEGALCGLFEDKEGCESIVVDKIVQKTVIDVNEEGVEAAAVTAIGVGVTSIPTGDPWLVVLDHPFQFFIYDKLEGLMLFEGRVGAPEVPDGVAAAAMDSKHTDEDFWSSSFGVDPVAPPVHETATGSTAAAGGASTALSVGDAGVGAEATEPTKPAGLSNATQPTEPVVSSNATQPTEAGGGSETSKPTGTAGSTDTTQPTEAAPFDPSDPSSDASNKIRFNLGACLFLATALGYVW